MANTIAVFTGTRAEYGLLYWLMKDIAADPELELKLIVSGTHLSPEFGLTYQQIEQDGFKIDERIEMLLSSEEPVVRQFLNAQKVGPIGMSEEKDADELAAGDLSLPWTAAQDYAVGEFARSRGAATPIRLVASAKSWLCHPGVDRRADILPAEAPAEEAPAEETADNAAAAEEGAEVAAADEAGKGTQVLLELTEPWHHSGRLVTADAYFASVEAALAMKEKGLTFIGNVKQCSRRFPMEFLGNTILPR